MEERMRKYKRRKSILRRLSESPKAQKVETVMLPVAFGILVVALWQGKILHRLFYTDTFVLPVPTKIFGIMGGITDKVIGNTIDTLLVAGIGLLLGSIIGYLVAVIASFLPNMGKGGLTIVGAFASIPIAALAPVMNNWTKDVSTEASFRSMISKILVVLLIAAANMGLNAYRGLTELKPYALDLMATYAASKRRIFVKLQLPNSLPYVFIALKVSVPASIMTVIVSEYFAEYITGIGRQIRENIVLAQYSIAWVYITVACMIGIVSYALLMVIQSLVLKRYR
jgi:NitT/TauT family transport system permease protein